MSFSDYYVTRRTRKGHFLRQIDALINWEPIACLIQQHYSPGQDVTGRPAYPGLLLFKMLLIGVWHGGLSDMDVEDLANANLHVMGFLGLALEDEVPDHSVLSRFRSRLTQAQAWDALLAAVNAQLDEQQLLIKSGVHVDASITPSPRKPKTRPTYEVVEDREARDDEPQAQAEMAVVHVTQAGVDPDGRWVIKGGTARFGFKQHTLVDQQGLVLAVETRAANQHDSQAFITLVERANLEPNTRVHGDKAYDGQSHRQALKVRQLKNGIQRKAVKNKSLTARQRQRNRLISKVRYVVERTFGSQKRWFNGNHFRYIGLAKAHAWHSLLAIAYNLKRLPLLFAQKYLLQPSCA